MNMQKFTTLMSLTFGVAAFSWGIGQGHAQTGPNPAVDYTKPNYANSPIIRKFVDSLPGLGPTGYNNLGQYIAVANADMNTYPGSDYYQIGLFDYTQKMHSDLPATKLRGYRDLSSAADRTNHYMGPLIIAQRDIPVRIKFSNMLATGINGNLFLPVDTTVMGAGMGPLGMAAMPMNYTQNRAVLHLHGGFTPWISDGTPHQWITPAGEMTPYTNGVSQQNVPDMPNPGPGSATYYYPNQQSGRLMFYHDHSYGMTRLNVYAGEAAGYLLYDTNELALINSGVLPNQGGGLNTFGIPLIIQDRTFVSSTTATTDPLWDFTHWGGIGNLWFPHVYVPNQDPNSPDGANPFGRWDYGPWFWPPQLPGTTPGDLMHPIPPTVSIVPEGYMDTPVVNGTAYPYMTVQPKAYRFRILNACNDRMLNLQLYHADPMEISVTNEGSNYSTNVTVTISGGGGSGAGAEAMVMYGMIIGITVTNAGTGYTSNPTVTISDTTGSGAGAIASINTEVAMVAAIPHSLTDTNWPARWPTDGRDGGVPDPATMGPSFIQIGTEGGLLPSPVVISNTPIGYEYNRRNIVVLNVSTHGLYMGPAERADVIIDFSSCTNGSTVILYNDAPAPVPAFDPRNDYYTGDTDFSITAANSMDPSAMYIGGAPPTLVGHGPNTRTIMQFRVVGTPSTPYNLAALSNALPATFAATQPKPLVPEVAYGAVTNHYSEIFDNSLTFTPIGSNNPITVDFQPKAIQELFDPYGRMNATLGVEIPRTTLTTQTTIPYGYIDPPTEMFFSGEAQLWKITHNGVDTHAIHFHLFNVQLINRVGWDGMVKPPDPNELGWKETIKMNPLEDVIVALRPTIPTLPFSVPNSIRPLDPTMPLGSTAGFTGVDPLGNPVTVSNILNDFGWEYVWHCHLLGHEENDMMRPMIMIAPLQIITTNLPGGMIGVPYSQLPVVIGGLSPDTWSIAAGALPGGLTLNTNTGAISGTPTVGGAFPFTLQVQDSNGTIATQALSITVILLPLQITTTSLPGGRVGVRYSQSPVATGGVTPYTWAIITGALPGGLTLNTNTGAISGTPTTAGTFNFTLRVRDASAVTATQALSITVTVLVAPSNLSAAIASASSITLAWRDNSSNENSFLVERSVNGGAFAQIGTVNRTAAQSTATGGTVAFTSTGLSAGNTYAYRVRAFRTAGSAYSAYSNTATVQFSAPSAPTGVMATASRLSGSLDRVILLWTASSNQTGYTIQRSSNAGGTWATVATVAANATAYTQTVARGQTYLYRIRANNFLGSSAWVVTPTTPRVTP